MKTVYSLNSTDLQVLKQNGIDLLPYDSRIGNYITTTNYDFLELEIRNKLTVTVPFLLGDEVEDSYNAVIILPTLMAFDSTQIELSEGVTMSVPDLFSSVYLICNELTFNVNLGYGEVSHVKIKKPVSFTAIEVRELTENDKYIVQKIKDLYNSKNPEIQIYDPLYFENKTLFYDFLRGLK